MEEEIEELKHLVRFLADTWSVIDNFVYNNCTGEQLMHYPIIQGLRNQINLQKIANQQYDGDLVKKAVSRMIDE